MNRFTVIDFETTGLSPAPRDRATEIGIVSMEDGKIVDRYQSLMNSGVHIPNFIQELTGITNAMVKKAPKISEVMKKASLLVNGFQLVAHNATFDNKFWVAEMARIGNKSNQPFIFSLLLARRILQDSPDHKLSTLISVYGLQATGKYHRALADAEAKAHLLNFMNGKVMWKFGIDAIEDVLYRKMMRTSKRDFDMVVRNHLKN